MQKISVQSVGVTVNFRFFLSMKPEPNFHRIVEGFDYRASTA